MKVNELEKENERLRNALDLITHISLRKETHCGPHRMSGIKGDDPCIACIAQAAQYGDGFHGITVDVAGEAIEAELEKFTAKGTGG